MNESTYVWLVRLDDRNDAFRVDGDADASDAVGTVADEVGKPVRREERLIDLQGEERVSVDDERGVSARDSARRAYEGRGRRRDEAAEEKKEETEGGEMGNGKGRKERETRTHVVQPLEARQTRVDLNDDLLCRLQDLRCRSHRRSGNDAPVLQNLRRLDDGPVEGLLRVAVLLVKGVVAVAIGRRCSGSEAGVRGMERENHT
jgi:hypothetical protein